MKAQTHTHMMMAILLSVLPAQLFAQVSVTPTFLSIDERTNLGQIYLNNSSSEPMEVSLSVEFGYPVSDETGSTIMVYDDDAKKVRHALDDYVRVFPRQIILGPNASQSIQLMVRPMQNKPNGVYWTRLFITSTRQTQDIECTLEEGQIGASITYILRQNIPVMYSKGDISTGLDVKQMDAEMTESRLLASALVAPIGNSPFIGSMNAVLRNQAGIEVGSAYNTLAAYTEILRAVSIPLPEEGLDPGSYSLEITFETRRRDISADMLIQAEPLRKTVQVAIE